MNKLINLTWVLIAVGFLFQGCNIAAPDTDVVRVMDEKSMAIPHSLVAEHEELYKQLQAAISSGGETGAAAKLVADQLGPHFAKEEEYALPPLTLLAPLAQGKSDERVSDVMKLSEKLSAELPQMLNEHKAITRALDKLVDVAGKENKSSAIEFAERLRQHARNEEEILYPAAILVGKYLKERQPRMP